MQAPELALSALAAIAAGRDPELAPPAARRVLTIAQSLMLAEPAGRESELAVLVEPQRALAKLAETRTALPEIRLEAGSAAHLLAVTCGSACLHAP
jgi:hypothetical protein